MTCTGSDSYSSRDRSAHRSIRPLHRPTISTDTAEFIGTSSCSSIPSGFSLDGLRSLTGKIGSGVEL